jgi:hypothetical protein
LADASREVLDVVASSEPEAHSFGVDWWTLLSDPQFLTNPYPDLKTIRELAPVHFDPASGIYFVAAYR